MYANFHYVRLRNSKSKYHYDSCVDCVKDYSNLHKKKIILCKVSRFKTLLCVLCINLLNSNTKFVSSGYIMLELFNVWF